MKDMWRFRKIERKYPRGPGDSKVLEMGEARVLLTTWEVTRDKAAVDRMLARTNRIYGQGAEERIRGYMRWIAKNERLKP
jgi:hypothetical protein